MNYESRAWLRWDTTFGGYLVALSSVLAFGADVPQYTVEGRYYSLVVAGRDNPVEMHRTFEVHVKGSSWLISTFGVGVQGKEMTRYVAATTDGREIHQLDVFTNDIATATIESNSVPTGMHDPAITHLWLMYGSNRYLDKTTDGYCTPVYDVVASAKYDPTLKLPTKVVRSQSPPFLPAGVVFISDGYWHTTDKDNKAKAYPMPPPFSRGFTNATYEVASFTNVGGLALPSRWEFREYAPDMTKSPPQLALRVKRYCSVELQRCWPVCKIASFVPGLTTNTVFLDHRLAKSSPPAPVVAYNLKAARKRWPTVAELKEIQKRQLRGNRPNWVMIVGLATIAVVPVAGLLWRLRRGASCGK